jgi:hypothetical protein
VSQLAADLTQSAAGAIASLAVFLVVTGLGKTCRGWRQPPGRQGRPYAAAADAGGRDDSAIRQALRLPAGAWRVVLPVVGCAEIGTGAAALSGRFAIGAGPAMMVLGVAFVILLGYARARRATGGCGCNSWRRRSEPVGWPSFLRAALLAGAGAAELTKVGAYVRLSPMPRPWFAAGALAAAGVLLLAGQTGQLRTPICHRPVLFPVRRTLRALAGHAAFAGMAAAAGPFDPTVLHKRNACTDQFWFSGSGGTVSFDVQHMGRSLAIRSAVSAAPGGPARPLRAGPGSERQYGRRASTRPLQRQPGGTRLPAPR